MHIIHADAVFRVEPGRSPDYDHDNPLLSLVKLMEGVQLAEERDCYLGESLQYLFPFQSLSLYGPAGGAADVLDPTKQDDKGDFQKQNLKDFRTADTALVRGWASVGDWTGPFLRVSYRGGPDSALSRKVGHALGDRVRLWLKVGDAPGQLLTVPYNDVSHRYEVELWGYPRNDLRERLGDKGRAAFDRGELLARNELVHGHPDDFSRERLEGARVEDVARDSTMHPVHPLRVELAWADAQAKVWDSQDGANYRYAFNMVVRGWEQYLAVGTSENPHGGVGGLEYRTLLSNYGPHGSRRELGRTLQPWNFDAFGRKQEGTRREDFLAVDYMDLHILKAKSGIGLHRHRDNQEVFLMMEGRGYMVVGDWAKLPDRERCFEVRQLRAGHMAMLKGGQLHGLLNPIDEDLCLFMFGGYD
jgi:mannose-6-phosphate isomerase-like protein (cupin superfamily)